MDLVLDRATPDDASRLANLWQLYAATRLFDAFRGPWEVRQLFRNTAATAFWRAVIGAYTGGGFGEVVVDDERWRGPVQAFDSRR